jgi:hypothetical protein
MMNAIMKCLLKRLICLASSPHLFLTLKRDHASSEIDIRTLGRHILLLMMTAMTFLLAPPLQYLVVVLKNFPPMLFAFLGVSMSPRIAHV